MLEKLERLVDEIGALHSRLILLVGPPGSGKTRLLRLFGESRGIAPLNVGAVLGRRLVALSSRQRPIQAAAALRELIAQHTPGDLLLLDNLELLFDETLKLNPLDLLRRQAQARRVVAVWPGDLHPVGGHSRLTYANINHPEYEDFAVDGVVLLPLET